MKRLAIITTHPIQYNAPWFKMLSERKKIAIKVFYTWGQLETEIKYDPGFGKAVDWDIPLLDGYEYTFVKNISTKAGSHHFNGIDNPSLIKEIENWEAEFILVFGWSFKSHLKVMRYFKGKRTVLFRGDSNLLDEKNGFSLKKAARKIFLKWVYNFVDIALYVGSANKNYYKQFGLKENQLAFAPHAIDNDRFGITTSNKRSLLGIGQNDIVFLFTGKFEAKKNPLLLIHTFLKLNDPGVHLLMVGNGKLEADLKVIANAQVASGSNKIHFLPFQNQLQMPSVYRTADIFVLPSQGPGETWGLAINEAMACSRTVLVSNKCGCATDLVKDGMNGYIFTANDESDLLQTMKALLEDKEHLDSMGEQSLQIIQDWSYENICLAVEQSVNNLKRK